MPWNKRTLAIPASPPSVRLARDWVTSVLRELGHDDLTDSARLAVSELVTNAILHAEPPMKVTVRGTPEHPRIEVADQSLVPPQRRHSELLIDVDDDRSWATIGRGLDLVASYSVRWGADISPNGLGKVVWFEPGPGLQEAPTEGEVFTMDAALADRVATAPDPGDLVTIRLLGMPVEMFSHLRRHFNELGRELRLLAISDPDRYPIAVEFAETYLQIEHERRQVLGLQDLDDALDAGKETVDLVYKAPPTAPASMARVGELLEEIYRTFGDDTLLAVRPSTELMSLQRWYLGEFSRQVAGHRPLPWLGPTRLAPRQEVS